MMGCDSIATTISRMGKEPTTRGPEDLKGHRFSAFWLDHFASIWLFFFIFEGAVLSTDRAGTPRPPP